MEVIYSEEMSMICIDEIIEKDQQRQKALELDELEELDEYELWDLQANEILNGSGSEFFVENKISADDA